MELLLSIFNLLKALIQDLDSAIDYKKAISINFLGGESMLSKENFYVLERLLEAQPPIIIP